MSTRSRWVLGVVVTLVAAVVVVAVVSSRGPATGPTASPSPTGTSSTRAPSSSPSPSTPAAPPSEAPAPSTAPPAAPPAATEPPSTPGAPELPVVGVAVTFSGENAASGSVEVGGYADTVELGGRCTLRLMQGATVVEAATEAFADATTTSCGTVSIPVAQLAPGTWTGTLLYSSSTARGESTPFPVEVR